MSNETPIPTKKLVAEKLDWLTGTTEIYSLDATDERLVTAQGAKAYVWKFSNILSKHKQLLSGSESSPSLHAFNLQQKTANVDVKFGEHMIAKSEQLLCTLDIHTSLINCVRFSPNTQMIASASDDSTVVVYILRSPFDLSQPIVNDLDSPFRKNVEEWQCLKIFRTHARDVLGVAWSSDSKLLASCSVDNRVVIYDIAKQEVLKILETQSIAKSVSFDPIGKYIVAESEKQVIVWSLTDWSEKDRISKPFECSVNTGIFFRTSWAPDGSHFAAANGHNGKQHTAPIFKRAEKFEYAFDVIGHKDAILVAQFNHRVFSDPENPEKVISIIAAGSTDKTLSIWKTGLARALIVPQQLFTQPISDIAWSKDGMSLVACSFDGSAALLTFSEQTLGKPLSPERLRSMLMETYGSVGYANSKSLIPEAPIAIEKPSTSFTAPSAPVAAPTPQPVSAPKAAPAPQIESRTKDGRRRITPVLISSSPSTTAMVEPPKPVETATFDIDISKFQTSNTKQRLDLSKVPVGSKRARVAASNSSPKKKARTGEKETLDIVKPVFLEISSTETLNCTADGKVEYIVSGQPKWDAFISDQPVLAVASSQITVVATKSSILHVFSSKGRRLLPPVIVDSTPKLMTCNANGYLAVLTLDEQLYLWNIPEQQCVIECSVDPLLVRQSKAKRIEVDDLSLTDTNVPIISLSTGDSYAYHANMRSWLLIADVHTPLTSFVSRSDVPYQNNASSINPNSLRFMKIRASKLAKENEIQQISSTNSHTSLLQTLSDLEINLASAATLKDSEYLNLVKSYVKVLSSAGDVEKLRDFLNTLIPSSSAASSSTIADIPKATVLQEALTVLSGNLSLQRVAIEYKEIIAGLISKRLTQ